MRKLDKYILEKLHLDKDIDNEKNWNEIERKVKNEFKNDDSIETLRFLLNFIKRSKNEPFKNSMFSYWEMGIKGNSLSCQHIGWSNSKEGWGKVKYIEKVIDNYNKDHGTNIKSNIGGSISSDYAGINIFYIKEVVEAFEKKYTDFELDKDIQPVIVGL